jgi:threonyl-tRNA synthetase
MFPVLDFGDEELVLRPMTCPHHVLIYKNDIQSYRDLPIRLAEESILHRYESSGSLTGFERVREMTLEDTHIFCSEDQIKDEVLNCYEMIIKAHKSFDTKIFQVDLALHNPDNKEKFHDDDEL